MVSKFQNTNNQFNSIQFKNKTNIMMAIFFLVCLFLIEAFLVRKIHKRPTRIGYGSTTTSCSEPKDPKNPKKNWNWNPNHPLYTVFWQKNEKCTELLEEMEANGMQVYFIDGTDVFANILWDEPIIYKNEGILSGWFDIYEEIYYNKNRKQ